jgi:methyltransferase (TIGR00027 family)
VTDGNASRTALGTALMRAVHTRKDRPQLIDDPWGDTLVSPAEKAALYRRILAGARPETRAKFEALGSEQAVIDVALHAHPSYAGVVVRTRYAEDALEAAVARGARQYVLIGAGFDSFIVRQPLFARDIEIFEIDHPATQAMKRERLEACGAAVSPNVRLVPADLATESLASVLARCGFSRIVPAFFSWLGVTVYLTRETNLATLLGIAESSAPASEVVFTYIDQRALEDGSSATMDRMRAARAAENEPWVSGFDPTTLADDLRALGLELMEDLGGLGLSERYLARRTDSLLLGRAGHIARAGVAAT